MRPGFSSCEDGNDPAYVTASTQEDDLHRRITAPQYRVCERCGTPFDKANYHTTPYD
jgi:hypothetical protein